MGDAISHAVLPGVAISYMFGFSYIFGATAFGMLTAAVIGFVTQRSRLKMIQRLELSLAPFCIRDYLDFICPECDRFVSYFIWECLSC